MTLIAPARQSFITSGTQRTKVHRSIDKAIATNTERYRREKELNEILDQLARADAALQVEVNRGTRLAFAKALNRYWRFMD